MPKSRTNEPFELADLPLCHRQLADRWARERLRQCVVLGKFIPSSRNRLRVNLTDDVADHLT